jgi:GTPase KRas protein
MEQDELNVEHRAAVLGAPGVGKSMIKWHLLYQRFVEDYDPVIEEAARRQVTVDDASCTLDLLETNSHEHSGYDSPLALYLTAVHEGAQLILPNRFQLDQFIRICEGFLCIYSITSRSSFDAISDVCDRILRLKEYLDDEADSQADIASVPMVLVGNKCDLESEREVTTAEGDELAKKLGCKFVEASAKESINMEHSFFTLVREIGRKKKALLEEQKKKLHHKKQGCILS